MPEDSGSSSGLDVLADSSLNTTDAMSLGGYDVDVLADASESALADLDDKSGWLNIASLA